MNQSIIQTTQGNVVDIYNKNGRVIRREIAFGKHGNSASDIKKKLKEANPDLKGRHLTDKVNAILSGEKDLRNALAREALNKACEDGVVDQISESSNLMTIKVKKARVTKQSVIDEQAEQLARMKAAMTDDQLKALGLTR